MKWTEKYTPAIKPEIGQIGEYINNPLWQELCRFTEATYGVSPQIEYSVCSGAPGWNVKYKKSSRALCILYPNEGFFTCLICIGNKEQMEAELVLTVCSSYVQGLFEKAKPYNGTRWLMIDVTSNEILEDVKRLLFVRSKPKR